MSAAGFVNTSFAPGFVRITAARQAVACISLRHSLHKSARSPGRQRSVLRRRLHPRAAADAGDGKQPSSSQQLSRPEKPEQTFFGLRLRTNGDVIKFGIVATVVPFAFKAVLQAAGVEDLKAGQLTTGFVSVFALLAWISTYVFRVGTKQMTYAQQLRDYEDQVIQKRYEELTDEELAALKEELKEES